MTCTIEGLAPGTSYEWQVQAVQGGQVSKWGRQWVRHAIGRVAQGRAHMAARRGGCGR